VTALLAKASLTFLATVCLHVLVWRIRRPVAYAVWVPALLAIFVLGGGAVAAVLVRALPMPGDTFIGSPSTQWAAIMMLQASVGVVYTFGYTLLLVGSPSLELLCRLKRSARGLLRSEIDLPLGNNAMIGPRVENLVQSGYIEGNQQLLRLTSKGRRLTGCVLVYRRTIGLPDGGGG
jgi:hypothetical protein